MDILCESEEEDGDTREHNEYSDSDDDWVPDTNEASDIEIEGVIEAEEEDDDEECDFRGEISVIADKYIATDQTEWYSQELPCAQTKSHNVIRKRLLAVYLCASSIPKLNVSLLCFRWTA